MEDIEIFLTETLVNACKRFVVGMLILVIGFWVTKFIVKRFRKSKLTEKFNEAAKIYIENAISVILRLIVILSAIAYLGVPMASVTAALGSAGLALSLALQGGLSNIAGGMILLFTHPFKIGDFVTVNNLTGTVEAINIYYTEIVTPDNQKILIPNGKAANSEITNFSAKEIRRTPLEFTVSYDTDIEKAKAVMLSEAKNNSCVLPNPEPVVFMTRHTDSSVVLTMEVWTKNADYKETGSRLLQSVKAKFDEEKIDIPYPQMDIHIKK